jgi:hypothetical protein
VQYKLNTRLILRILQSIFQHLPVYIAVAYDGCRLWNGDTHYGLLFNSCFLPHHLLKNLPSAVEERAFQTGRLGYAGCHSSLLDEHGLLSSDYTEWLESYPSTKVLYPR